MSLPENIRIPGMTGILHPLWMERFKGRCDGSSQVRKLDKGYSTPYIERAYNCFHSAANKVYRQVVDDLDPTFQETAHNLQELLGLRNEKAAVPEEYISGEEGQRVAALHAAQRRAQLQRERELVIRLKELREIFETADERMAHWCCQANAIVRMRLSCYWDGILKSSGNEALPPFPIPEAEEIPGQRRFQERVGKVLNQIAEGLNVCEEGRAFNV